MGDDSSSSAENLAATDAREIKRNLREIAKEKQHVILYGISTLGGVVTAVLGWLWLTDHADLREARSEIAAQGARIAVLESQTSRSDQAFTEFKAEIRVEFADLKTDIRTILQEVKKP